MLRFNFCITFAMYLQRKHTQVKCGLSHKTYQQRKLQYSVKLFYKSPFFSVVTRRDVTFHLSRDLAPFSGAIQKVIQPPCQWLTPVAVTTCSNFSPVSPICTRSFFFLWYFPAVPSHNPREIPPSFLPSGTGTPAPLA